MTGEENDPAADEAPTTDRPVDVEITSTHDADAIEAAVEAAAHPADHSDVTSPGMRVLDAESTVDLTGDDLDAVAAASEHDSGAPAEPAPAEDDSGLPAEAAAEHDPRSPEDAAPSLEAEADSDEDAIDTTADVSRGHLKGLLEALIFASDKPIKANELAKSATAQTKQVKELLEELKVEFSTRGVQLDEVAGGWIFRTNAQFAPFVRDLTKQKPVKLTRAQIETLSILAYRQPITRPEIDEIRGVDSGPVLKLLLERDLVRILGKKDEPGRPILYGTTPDFLEFFGLKSLKDLPTLREFSDLTEESRRVVERELGETLEGTAGAVIAGESTAPTPHAGDTLPPSAMLDGDEAMSSVTDAPPPMPALEELEEVSESDDEAHHAHETEGPHRAADAHATDAPHAAAEETDEPREADDDEPASDEPRGADARKPGDTDEPAAPDAPALNADDEAEFPDDDDSEFDDDDDDDDDDDEDEDEEEDADE